MKQEDVEMNYPIVLTAKDVSEIIKFSKPMAYEIKNKSDFPLIRFGRCKRVLREEFFEWLK